MPKGQGYTGYGGPNESKDATGFASTGPGPKGETHDTRTGSHGSSLTESDERYMGRERPMYLDADEGGEAKFGPWPPGKGKGKTSY